MGIKSTIFAGMTALAVSVAVLAGPASAAPIKGSIDLNGALTVVGPWTAPTALTFAGSEVDVPKFDPGTLDLSIFSYPDSGTIQDLTNLNPVTFTEIDNFYTISHDATTLSFDLKSIDVVLANAGGNYSITVNGKGTMNLTGYDATPGTFSLTTQCTGGLASGDCTKSIISFSSTSTATGVPEPASIALLGAGLAGLGVRRKKRNA